MYNPNFSIPSSTLPLTKCVQTRHTSNSFGGIIVKLLARADFYQQKMKELEKLDLQFEKKKAPCSSETTNSGNSALSSLQVQLATNKFKIRPRTILSKIRTFYLKIDHPQYYHLTYNLILQKPADRTDRRALIVLLGCHISLVCSSNFSFVLFSLFWMSWYRLLVVFGVIAELFRDYFYSQSILESSKQ